jgi:hypothetical protein
MNTKSQTPAQAPAILSREQLANYLGVCTRTIHKLDKQGILRPIKLGKRVVYSLDSVLEDLDRLEKQSTPQPTSEGDDALSLARLRAEIEANEQYKPTTNKQD